MWRPSQREMSVISLSSACMDIRGQEDIFTDSLRAHVRELNRTRKRREKRVALAGDLGSDEEQHFVHEIGGEERRREGGPAFKQDRLHVLVSEARELPFELPFERPAQKLQLRALRER